MKEARVLMILESPQPTQQERDELILEYQGLAKSIANRASGNVKRLKDDIESEAILELIESVDRICDKRVQIEGGKDGLIKYLRTSIKYRCKDYIEMNVRTMHMSGRTIRHKMLNGLNDSKEISPRLFKSSLPLLKKEEIMKLPIMYQDSFVNQAEEISLEELKLKIKEVLNSLLPIPKVCLLLEDYPRVEDQQSVEAIYKSTPQLNAAYHVPKSRPTIEADILEMIKLSIQSPIEDKIIQMRAEGYTYEEIAPKVGMCFRSVGGYVMAVEKRYEQYEKM